MAQTGRIPDYGEAIRRQLLKNALTSQNSLTCIHATNHGFCYNTAHEIVTSTDFDTTAAVSLVQIRLLHVFIPAYLKNHTRIMRM